MQPILESRALADPVSGSRGLEFLGPLRQWSSCQRLGVLAGLVTVSGPGGGSRGTLLEEFCSEIWTASPNLFLQVFQGFCEVINIFKTKHCA